MLENYRIRLKKDIVKAFEFRRDTGNKEIIPIYKVGIIEFKK